MTYKPGQHVYLASGFFNDDQRDLCDFVESFETSELPIYSPRIDGGVLKPDASQTEIKEIFDSNKLAIKTADWVLAVIDDFDPGVIWEMGYAHAVSIKMLGYSDVEGRGLNVMLAGACNLGFINGREALGKLLRASWPIEFPYNTWSGTIQ
jgi:nucleoside 2-deoxyribosyltransferase